MNIRGVIFDKDGTLFDFQSTWGIWTAQVLARIAGSDEALLQQLAEALGYDTQPEECSPAVSSLQPPRWTSRRWLRTAFLP